MHLCCIENQQKHGRMHKKFETSNSPGKKSVFFSPGIVIYYNNYISKEIFYMYRPGKFQE